MNNVLRYVCATFVLVTVALAPSSCTESGAPDLEAAMVMDEAAPSAHEVNAERLAVRSMEEAPSASEHGLVSEAAPEEAVLEDGVRQ